jgi:hypothetical protein
MKILAARKYRSPRNGQLSLEEAETRRLAYAIKGTAARAQDFETAAKEMAALITGPCWLVPIPSCTGNTDANTILAAAIARHVDGAQVVKALYRERPIQSQCDRHKRGMGATPAEQHHIWRTNHLLTLRQVYFIDNVSTSGHTMHAAKNAFGFGAGLVFADAANRQTQIQETLL